MITFKLFSDDHETRIQRTAPIPVNRSKYKTAYDKRRAAKSAARKRAKRLGHG